MSEHNACGLQSWLGYDICFGQRSFKMLIMIIKVKNAVMEIAEKYKE